MSGRTLVGFILAVMTGGAGSAQAAPPLLEPVHPDSLIVAREIVQRMKTGDRGPYKRIRWYCKDGAVLAPEPYACVEHGGGHQYAEYSADRERLARMGWSVGTIITALTPEEYLAPAGRRYRLRQLPVERYLTDVDDGWVLRKAQFYRGRVQIEDEEYFGQQLLQSVLADREFVASHFLLIRELVRAVPHSRGGDKTRSVRRIAQEIAEKDPTFEKLRVKIHTNPAFEDVAAVKRWADAASARSAAPELIASAKTLMSDLTALHGPAGRKARLESLARRITRNPMIGIDADIGRVLAGTPAARIASLGRTLRLVREAVERSDAPEASLDLLDLSLEIEDELTSSGLEYLRTGDGTRRSSLEVVSSLAAGAFGAGLLSEGERLAITMPVDNLLAAQSISPAEYLAALQPLRRAGGWALGTVRFTFAEALTRFKELEPKSSFFPDDVLRGSSMLVLADLTNRLLTDAEEWNGVKHRILGEAMSRVVGLNPGLAAGRLRVLTAAELEHPVVDPKEIVVLPETISELGPVAGILTLAEGNILSHIQLLARNLGIPNATLSPVARRRIAESDGMDVVLAVGSNGAVVLSLAQDLPADAANVMTRTAVETAQNAAVKIDAPAPDLGVRRLVPLRELRSALSGKVVGPKAANLGELAKIFPEYVAPAIGIPFGIYANEAMRAADPAPARLKKAFQSHRAGALSDSALAAEVENVRVSIAGLTLSSELRDEIRKAMARDFGPAGTYGFFVRSDTNVEDLPGFTGAGLNKTIPNIVDQERLWTAIPEVWSSPFTARAMAWRGRILTRPEEVYPSVLLMKSVAAEKSGVMVTADIIHRGEGLTIATAWGVGGAVDNEAAGTVVIRPDGSVETIAEAKAPYCRRLAAAGGLEWVEATSGPVLTEQDRAQLVKLAAVVESRLVREKGPDGDPLPWDIEFGFERGELRLFQIRPLIERGQVKADRFVRAFDSGAVRTEGRVDLDKPLPRFESGASP